MEDIMENYKRILTGKIEVMLEDSPLKSESMIVKQHQENNDKQIISGKQHVVNELGQA